MQPSLREPLEHSRVVAVRLLDDLAQLRGAFRRRHGRDDQHATVRGDFQLGLRVDVRLLQEPLVQDERQAVPGLHELLAHGTYKIPFPFVPGNAAPANWPEGIPTTSPCRPRPGCHRRAEEADQEVASAGNRTVKVDPRPGSDSTSMRPLSARAISLPVGNPRPGALPAALVVKNGSKMRRFTSGPM